VAVGGVFAVAEVGDGEHVDAGVFGAFEGGADFVVGVVGVGADGVFFGGVGDAEEDVGGEAEGLEAFEFFDGGVWGELVDAGHGFDGLAEVGSGADEEGCDEV
jgi:hypothetical protein